MTLPALPQDGQRLLASIYAPIRQISSFADLFSLIQGWRPNWEKPGNRELDFARRLLGLSPEDILSDLGHNLEQSLRSPVSDEQATLLFERGYAVWPAQQHVPDLVAALATSAAEEGLSSVVIITAIIELRKTSKFAPTMSEFHGASQKAAARLQWWRNKLLELDDAWLDARLLLVEKGELEPWETGADHWLEAPPGGARRT